MKPFDLEQAKAGAPIVTRDGRKVRFVAHVPEADELHRVISVSESGSVYHHSEQGKMWSFEDCGSDLFMAPVKKKFQAWMNLYKNGDVGVAFDTEEGAKAQARSGYVETRLIEWEVEQ